MAPSHSSTITRVGAAPLIHRAMLTPLICAILGLALLSVFCLVAATGSTLQYDIEASKAASAVPGRKQPSCRLK
jgi:hypothetical protein